MFSRDESIKKSINYIANNTKGQNINYYGIMQQCREQFDSSPTRFSHGKTALGELKKQLQRELKQNPKLYQKTDAICQKELIDILNS